MINENKSDFIFKSNYFRITLVILEDTVINDLTLTFK